MGLYILMCCIAMVKIYSQRYSIKWRGQSRYESVWLWYYLLYEIWTSHVTIKHYVLGTGSCSVVKRLGPLHMKVLRPLGTSGTTQSHISADPNHPQKPVRTEDLATVRKIYCRQVEMCISLIHVVSSLRNWYCRWPREQSVICVCVCVCGVCMCVVCVVCVWFVCVCVCVCVLSICMPIGFFMVCRIIIYNTRNNLWLSVWNKLCTPKPLQS